MPLEYDWTPTKVLVRKDAQSEWLELGEVKKEIAFVASETANEAIEAVKVGHLRFSYSIRIAHKTIIRLKQQLGLLKRPKCTCKTIRRDCAKRNMYK